MGNPFDFDPQEEQTPRPRRNRRGRSWLAPAVAVGVAVLLVGAALAWFAWLSPSARAAAHLERGRFYAGDGHPRKAIEEFTESIRIAPSGEAYCERGLVWYEMGQLGSAIEDSIQAKHLAPNNPKVRKLVKLVDAALR